MSWGRSDELRAIWHKARARGPVRAMVFEDGQYVDDIVIPRDTLDRYVYAGMRTIAWGGPSPVWRDGDREVVIL